MSESSGAPAVVATAGHVDHGKSSLVRRLTGMDPDRLAEEKRRGLTIELGYAWCTLPSGSDLGFVDVPGHERFVRTMLAGVGPVRLVLFVVAADEGWKPQSEEHLEIVDVLGVSGAVVALTKRDLVDDERLARARAETTEHLSGTGLERAPLIACSSATGEGVAELIVALDEMVAAAPEPERTGRPRQHIDRVFSIRGSGTVLTGTLTGGPVSVGDEIELVPSGVRARIRGLQTHRRRVDAALPVSRVAANIAGAGGARIARGEVLSLPRAWRPTAVFEGWIEPVRSLDRPLTSRGAFKLHAGAAERDVRIRLYEPPKRPREGAFARITLSDELVLDVGDRFVLRESGRRETLAGGVVLDTDPLPRAGPDPARRLDARRRAAREELPALLVSERRALLVSDIALDLGIEPDHVSGAVRLRGWWAARDLLEELDATVASSIASFHAREPTAEGQDVEIVRRTIVDALTAAGAPRDPDLADAAIDRLIENGVIAREGTHLRLATHAAERSQEGENLVEVVREAEPTPPSIAELRAAGFSARAIESAIRSGAVVRISPTLVLSSEFVARAEQVVRGAGDEGITVSALRERLETTRKYAVPLLEHLDRAGVTRRSGDLRFARGARHGADG